MQRAVDFENSRNICLNIVRRTFDDTNARNVTLTRSTLVNSPLSKPVSKDSVVASIKRGKGLAAAMSNFSLSNPSKIYRDKLDWLLQDGCALTRD